MKGTATPIVAKGGGDRCMYVTRLPNLGRIDISVGLSVNRDCKYM